MRLVTDRREAMEILGLEPGVMVTRDRVRRAYLEKLRVHSPERDPEGFRQLQEAYETFEKMADLLEQALATGALGQHAGERVAEVPPAEPPPPAELPTARVIRTTRAVPLARKAPASRDPAGAARSARSGGRADEPDSLGAVTDEILVLLHNGKVDAAVDLSDRWNRTALDDHREVSRYAATRWALSRELLEIASELPRSLRSAIALGIASDQLSSAEPSFERLHAKDPQRMRDIAAHMARRAPRLYHVFSAVFQRREQAVLDQRQKASVASPGRLFMWLCIAAALAISRASSCERASTFDRHRFTPPPTQRRLDPAIEQLLRSQPRPTLPSPPIRSDAPASRP